MRTKVVDARLGVLSGLPTVEEAKAGIATPGREVIDERLTEEETKRATRLEALEAERLRMVKAHRAAREQLRSRQRERAAAEAFGRASRFRRGLLGLWDRITGQQARLTAENAAEARACAVRDQSEHQALVASQLQARRALQGALAEARSPSGEAAAHVGVAVKSDRTLLFNQGIGGDRLTIGEKPEHMPDRRRRTWPVPSPKLCPETKMS